MHVSNHILQPYFVHLFFSSFFLLRLCWRFKQNELEGKKIQDSFCIFPFQSQRVSGCSKPFTLTQPRSRRPCVLATAPSPLAVAQKKTGTTCLIIIAVVSITSEAATHSKSELIPRYWAAARWKKLSLKSHTMWERDVQRASAGRRILTFFFARVWEGGDRKGDICAANVAQV